MTRPFRETLSKLRQGEVDDELTEAIAQVVQAVRNTDKPGSLTLTINCRPTKGLALEFDADISMKLPKLPKPTTFLFPTVEGNLQENNPMQKSLDLTIVNDGGTKQLNTIKQEAVVPLATIGTGT